MDDRTAAILARLRELPPHDVTATLRNPRGSSTRTYRGALLYDYARAAGMTPSSSEPTLGFGNYYFVVTSSDGFMVTLAYFEVTPRATSKQVLLAYEQDGEPLQVGVRLIVPGDDLGGRSVLSVADVQFKSVPSRAPSAENAPADGLTLGGLLERRRTLSTADLAALPQTNVLTEPSPRRGGVTAPGRNYQGVRLWDLLAAAGPVLDPNVNEDVMRKLVVAYSADGNCAVLAPGELDPRFMGGDAIVATALEGVPLGADGGPLRLVVAYDRTVGRALKSLTAVELTTA